MVVAHAPDRPAPPPRFVLLVRARDARSNQSSDVLRLAALHPVLRFTPPVCLLRPSAVSRIRRPLRARPVARSRTRRAAATRHSLVPPSWFPHHLGGFLRRILAGVLHPAPALGFETCSDRHRLSTTTTPHLRLASDPPKACSRWPAVNASPNPARRHRSFTALRFPPAVAPWRSTSGRCSDLRSACGHHSRE